MRSKADETFVNSRNINAIVSAMNISMYNTIEFAEKSSAHTLYGE